MRSKTPMILATFHSCVGPSPGLIHLAHRSLEKSKPVPSEATLTHLCFLVPLDLVRMIDPTLTQGIKSITLGYRRRAS